MSDLMALARAEREELLALVRDLSADEWDRDTLCAGWTVRDVVAHVFSYDELTWAGTVATFVRGAMRFDRVNDVALRAHRDDGPDDLIARIERCLVPRGVPAGFKGGIALADGLIHQQDVRRPLGRPRTIPEDRLLAALGIAMTAPTLPTKGNVKGLRLLADDLDWRHGDGPEVTGPAESLLMAATGRAAALPELAGAGLELLTSRVDRARSTAR